MPRISRAVGIVFLALVLFVIVSPAFAQPPQMTTAPAVSTPPTGGRWDTGSTAWMLTSSALVLFMVPGLALFYGGMVRAKNVLNMFLCVMVAIGVIGLHWVIIGYAMAFPANAPLISIGGAQHARLRPRLVL